MINLSEEKIKIITKYWIRILEIKLGWIQDFDRLVVDYVIFFDYYLCHYLIQASEFFLLDAFRSSSKLLQIFYGHTKWVNSIDYSAFNDGQFICSGSEDETLRVWDVENNEQIQSFNGHFNNVDCVKFSPYHYYNNRCNVICSSSHDIHFWDFKHNKQLGIFNGHTDGIRGIEFSSFNGGRYLCSGSYDKTVRLWDVETSKTLHVFNGYDCVLCVGISPLQSNSNNDSNKSNSVGVIGGNGYTICSGSYDTTIRIWDIETTKQLNIFKGHKNFVMAVKYGPNESVNSGRTNTILSGSLDKSVRLWDIRSDQQIQVFNGHTAYILDVEYSPFVVNNIEVGDSSSVICSGSEDNTIRFWDIRLNKKELYVINGDSKEDNGIICLKFLQLKKNRKSINDRGYGINLCYGSGNGPIHIWG
ncbi:WD repeat-containing protein [Reticulomyxa filosa]|uniref:WD repeat-containing protein n=1 Tax=Reticulomyxa filosa TaxID=46433 RepID=X6MPP5_RETFI|nr:WD repeat-containing protein [Reticulomyxa filosa]|eukprot:ETO15651.1 WD repeat-containing protein [Reticulomyxa filosa]